MKSKFVFALAGLFLLAACSSWSLKEKCDKTNWFEYSRDVALNGRYLEEDGFIKECKGVDHISSQQIDIGFKSGRDRYCTFESFFRNGEVGEPVNFKMCDGLTLYQMQERYAQGLKSFCTGETGYTYGASGKVYKNVCLKKEEEKFLPKYFTGRYEYLQKSLAQLENDSQSLKVLQSNLQAQISNLSLEVQALPSVQECHTANVYDEAAKANVPRTVCKEPFYIQSRRDNLYSHLDPLRQQYSSNGDQILKIESQLQTTRSELTKIPVMYQSAAVNLRP
jgi:hypothetical protein